jgi:glycosyltransferase involved in cell wall biosynthesis
VALPDLPDIGRAELGLPSDAFLFVCPFDPNSYLARKNPQAAVRAFRAAFPASDKTVGLVLRANGSPHAAPGWAEVMAATGDDPRILCVSGTLPRPRALALLRACDALVSPHRAEGYGRNIAEAILLRRPVLATGFSGCVDFLKPQEMIAWTRRAVRAGDYPFAEGMWWAEPDEADLARKMQTLRAAPPEARWLGQRARAFNAQFSPAAAGRRYAKRLAEICRQLSR